MPVIQRKGAQSSQGFGEFAQSSSTAAANYIEDYFSTYLYTGTGAEQTINNGIGLADTAAWSSYKLQQNGSEGYGVVVDSSGNFYVNAQANDGTYNYLIVAKYNSSGVIQWQRKLQQLNSYGTGIALDNSNNIYVTGYANDGTNVYIVIAKYNSSGTIQWQRKLKQNDSYGQGIVTDSSGNVYLVGRANDGTRNYILTAKYDSSGTIQWQRKLYQNSSSHGYGITVDSTGNIYVTGRANNGTNLYIIVAKYDSSGAIQWQRKLEQSGGDGQGIVTDSSGNVYVTGYSNDATLDGILIAKYNSSGVIQWQRRLVQNASRGFAVSVDSSGNIYVTGRANDGTQYIIVAKYNSSGTIQWQRSLKQNASVGYGITTDSSGNVYVIGSANDGTNNYSVTSKLKQDGTTTSGTAIVTLSTSAATDSAGTATESAGTATESAAGATDSAGAATDSAGTATATSATQAAVTGGGGLVWIKSRSTAYNHNLFDTANGATKLLHSNTTAALTTDTTSLTSFTASGFNLGTGSILNNQVNSSGSTFVSWTFRKQAKFFDVVTYTGDGANRTISHNLGSVPGCIIVKNTNTSRVWAVYHRSLANTEYLTLDATAAKATSATYWNSTTPTSTVFSLGTSPVVNGSGNTYIAYLFAHDAGGFGSAGTDNVISCGSYAGNNALQTVNLGYEAQWVLIKNATGAYDWSIYDNMRGMAVGAINNPALYPNLNAAEAADRPVYPTSTGFAVNTAATIVNATGDTYIYIAIRRGPMKTPTSGTSVFSPVARTGTGANVTVSSGFVTDSALTYNRGGTNPIIASRLTSTGYLATPSSTAENAGGATVYQSNPWDVMDGIKLGTTSALTNQSGQTFINYFFQRAPGFFDQVCYTGTGSATTQTHNLGAVPELIIVKRRNAAGDWAVYSSALSNTEYLVLNSSVKKTTGTTYWNSTTPTSSVFSIGTNPDVNASGGTYIARLFATVSGVSKVGSYTGTGALQTVNCGFTSGARFVLIKRTDASGDWFVWDSARGISSSNDPYFQLNSSAAEVTTTNYVDTDTTGFKVTAAAPSGINANGGSYLFLAIA